MVMDIKCGEFIKFYPDYKGNLDLPKGEQFWIEIMEISWRAAENYRRRYTKRGRPDQNAAQRKIFMDNTGEMGGFSINGEEILTGEQLYNHKLAPFKLIRDIIKAIEEEELDEEENEEVVKN